MLLWSIKVLFPLYITDNERVLYISYNGKMNLDKYMYKSLTNSTGHTISDLKISFQF